MPPTTCPPTLPSWHRMVAPSARSADQLSTRLIDTISSLIISKKIRRRRRLGSVDPVAIKHVVADEHAVDRTHPTFMPLAEQWEKGVQALQRLKTGEAYVRLADDSVHKIHTPKLPKVIAHRRQLDEVRLRYFEKYFIQPDEPSPMRPKLAPSLATIGRRVRAGTIYEQ